MKQCRVCQEWLPFSCYSKHASTRDKLQGICKSCHSEWYKKHVAKKRETDPQYKRGASAKSPKLRWYEDQKKQLSCTLCGEDHPATLDFHHKYPKTKVAGINEMARKGKYTIEDMIVEMDKCVVLCSNCHRKLHYKGD